MRKKIMSCLRCISIFMSLFTALNTVFAAGESLSGGMAKLRTQFQFGMASNNMDYDVYSPVKNDGDKTKYPLVVWIHGFFSGAAPGLQVTNNDISYWTSKEFQARFPQGGAFILCPRSKEAVDIWSDLMAADLKLCIDYFISKHSDNVDTTRIYIGGLSTGAKMVYTMCSKYPEMFAAAFPCSPTSAVTSGEAIRMKDIPVWLLAATHDDRASYDVQVASWKRVVAASNKKSDCRIAVFNGKDMLYPDGSKVDHPHDTWFAANYDMFTKANQSYYNMSVLDGNGKTVNLTYPKGMISWLSQFHSNYQGTKVTQSVSMYTIVLGLVYAVINRFVIVFGIKGIA
ncbi:MAG: hypothetical protein MJ177_07040 [Clostridia bacterium]|nr:hypothetical protein [Clostridia bacterium]